ncbi:MAG TPA: TIGR01777 family oxidoreductase [Kineosporiaceae bacterium]
MRTVVTGASGFIGSALVNGLRAAGHDVVRLVRRPARLADEISWDPTSGRVEVGALAGVEAAVNLAGAGVGDRRWTAEYKRTILSSRVESTGTLVKTLAQLDPPPRVLVSASASGYYGDRGDEPLTEGSAPGDGFLSEVVQAWEAAAEAATSSGVRVVLARTGLVLSPEGGALGRLLPIARLGLGGPLGSGRQWWPWITLADEVSALMFLLEHIDLAGPVNLSAPQPARNLEVTRALGHALRRPTIVPAPAFALRLVLGEFAGEVLSSQRMLPMRLLEAGFAFRHQTATQAAAWVTRPR